MGVLDLFRLDSKVALVTGANRGLGQAIAAALSEAGADVVGLNRSDDPGGTDLCVENVGRRYHHIALDLATSSSAQLSESVTQVIDTMGRLDILVNNAGIVRRTPAIDYPEADWDEVVQINLKAVFLLSQAAAQYMGDGRGGKIINIASMLSYQGGIFVPAYTAAKHGVLGITRALANEWAANGINVNAIAPGYMATDNTSALRTDEHRNSAILARIPAGRWGEPGDMKGAAVFLSSAASDYINGATIDVDGGWMAR